MIDENWTSERKRRRSRRTHRTRLGQSGERADTDQHGQGQQTNTAKPVHRTAIFEGRAVFIGRTLDVDRPLAHRWDRNPRSVPTLNVHLGPVVTHCRRQELMQLFGEGIPQGSRQSQLVFIDPSPAGWDKYRPNPRPAPVHLRDDIAAAAAAPQPHNDANAARTVIICSGVRDPRSRSLEPVLRRAIQSPHAQQS
jgi:hypothetical protein